MSVINWYKILIFSFAFVIDQNLLQIILILDVKLLKFLLRVDGT